MTTTQIQYFLLSAQLLNFTAAADRLYVAQPTLSRQISLLEEEVGAKLFERRNNVVSLTPAGELLAKGLTCVYSEINTILKNLRSFSDKDGGSLSFGLLEDQVLDDMLTRSFRELARKRPHADINISRHGAKGLFGGLMDGSLDVVFMLVYDDVAFADFSHMPIFRDLAHIAILRDHPAASRDTITLAESLRMAKDLPLIIMSLDAFPHPMRHALLQPFQPLSDGFPGTPGIKSVSSFSSIPLLVEAGLGFAFVNSSNILARDPKIKLIPVTDGEYMSPGLLWRTGNTNPALGDFLSIVKRLKPISGSP
ncbi:MAG: LysR family transcriptional regulator [Lachnospiraceae bacterium]|jgi:DNA-binding transcriptional LysR family regulator|nr:LysR family transcriptional regulator [Lachnospiraceae bacterium]